MPVQREVAPRGDAEIEFDVRETLRWDMRVDDTNIDLSVADGNVSLTGSVSSASQKLAAGEDAARIKGVRGVANDIAVQPQVLRRDADIASDVIDALRRDRRVNVDNLAVSVRDGIVRLTGSSPTIGQRRAAGEDAWYTAGVIDLVNEIRVVPVRRRSDAVLLSDVQTALALSGRIQDPMGIDVSVQNGMVHLTGNVENDMERHAAEEAARLIAGVTHVENGLQTRR